MGNKPSSLDLKYGSLYTSQGNNLKKYTSEEDYVPMSWSMRKSLLEKNRFHHFVPQQKQILEHDETGDTVDKNYDKGGSIKEIKDSENATNKTVVDTNNYKVEDSLGQVDDIINISQSVDKRVEPVVTVLNVSAIKDSRSQLDILQENSSKLGNQRYSSKDYTPCQKSPNPTNKTYSLVNLGTGLTKSKFTLELEDKLRQSKFDLGFDADINDWKEFTYRVESPECRKRSVGIPKVKLLGEEHFVGRGLEKVYLKDPLQYCNHDCQILGLCSVRPNILRTKDTIEEPNLANKALFNLADASNCFNLDKENHKKDNCNCQHCTLAFLTEMKFPEHNENTNLITVKRSKHRSFDTIRSKKSSNIERVRLPFNRSTHTMKTQRSSNQERIRISKIGEFSKSIEVSVKDRSERSSTVKSLVSDCTLCESNLSYESYEDCTNRRIRKIFRSNKDKSPKKGIKRNKVIYNEIPFLNSNVEEKSSSTYLSNSSPERIIQIQTADLRQTVVFNKYKVHKKSSGSTIGASVSSSLSTIMSYKRVREIFQSIIEKNRNRKRPKKNINKFKEMEELGLGKVKNNRWYPSDSKTYTIWNDLNQNVRGVQAEFKKFTKVSSKESSQ